MNIDIKVFQRQYVLSNRDMAQVCQCSLPTIQKWRSGEVTPSGAAQQLMRLLDYSAAGDPAKLREMLSTMNRRISPSGNADTEDLQELESSMSKVVDRLELMLESRRKDKELAESEARYRSMVESHRDPVCRWLPDTTLMYVNDSYAKLFLQFGEDLVGRKWIDFIPQERRQAVMTLVHDVVRRAEPEVTMHEAIGKDGKTQFHEWWDIPILNDRGDVVELHSIGHDITEKLQLRESVKELDNINQTILSLCENPILIFNADGEFLEMNEGFRQQVLKSSKWNSLSKMLPSTNMGRFRRLLVRLSDSSRMVYQVQIRETIFTMKVQVLMGGMKKARYIAYFERADEIRDRTVLQTRLSKEIVLDGQSREYPIGKKHRESLQESMQLLGKGARVDRVYAFTFDHEEKVFDNILEWCAEGVEGHLDELQRVPEEDYPWWIKKLKKPQWIQVEDTLTMPRTASREKELLLAQDIRAILVAPLEVDGIVCGFVGFDQNHSKRIWHSQEIEALSAFKQEIEEVLVKTQKCLAAAKR